VLPRHAPFVVTYLHTHADAGDVVDTHALPFTSLHARLLPLYRTDGRQYQYKHRLKRSSGTTYTPPVTRFDMGCRHLPQHCVTAVPCRARAASRAGGNVPLAFPLYTAAIFPHPTHPHPRPHPTPTALPPKALRAHYIKHQQHLRTGGSLVDGTSTTYFLATTGSAACRCKTCLRTFYFGSPLHCCVRPLCLLVEPFSVPWHCWQCLSGLLIGCI